MKLRIAVFACFALGACVSTMKAPPSPAQPATGAQATNPATSAVPAAVPAAPESELAHWAKSHDYSLTTVGKRLLWCKDEVTVASRIPQRTCLTEADLAMFRRVNEQNKEAMLHSTNACPNATCTKGN